MEKVHLKMLVCSEKGEELVQPGIESEECLEVCFVGLVVEGNYVWCLLIVVIFTWFGKEKWWGNTLKSSFGADNASHKEGMGRGGGAAGGSLCNTAVLKLYCMSDWAV